MMGCSFHKQANDRLPCIDVSKNYPEKEILLTDIADVTYLHLNTDNSDYLYKSRFGSVGISENLVIISDISSGSILFFSRDGNPVSRFNRYGNGAGEYPFTDPSFFYDNTSNEIFVNVFDIIHVYAPSGEYKRKLTLPTRNAQILNYDDQSIFVRDMQIDYNQLSEIETDFSSHPSDSSYFRISKTDGKVLEYVIRPRNIIDFTISEYGGEIISRNSYSYMEKSADGLLLCNPKTDTVFLYAKDRTLTPVFCKTPLVSKLDPMVVLTDFVDAGKYQFMKIKTNVGILKRKEYPDKYYLRDKQTNEIFRQKLILPDYPEKEFFISGHNASFKQARFELDLIELKQAYKENKLSGKLKDLVATLNENKDNNVYVVAKFK